MCPSQKDKSKKWSEEVQVDLVYLSSPQCLPRFASLPITQPFNHGEGMGTRCKKDGPRDSLHEQRPDPFAVKLLDWVTPFIRQYGVR